MSYLQFGKFTPRSIAGGTPVLFHTLRELPLSTNNGFFAFYLFAYENLMFCDPFTNRGSYCVLILRDILITPLTR